MNLPAFLIAFAVVGIAFAAAVWFLSKPLRETP